VIISLRRASILECGGNPDSSGHTALDYDFALLILFGWLISIQSAVAASICRRTPNHSMRSAPAAAEQTKISGSRPVASA
jgi:hypothetical protein